MNFMLEQGYEAMPSKPEEHNGKWAQEDYIFTRKEYFTNFKEDHTTESE